MICTGITYDSDYNRIKVQYNGTDGTKGASFSNPYTFEDIYDTAIYNNWTGITKFENVYTFDNITIQSTDTNTYIADNYITHIAKGDVQTEQYKLRFFNCNIKFEGCTFDHLCTTPTRITANKNEHEFIGCIFKNYMYLAVYCNMFNCFLDNVNYPYCRYGTYWKNTNFVNCTVLWTYGISTIENINIIDGTYGVFLDGQYANTDVYEFNNIKIINCNYDVWVRCRVYSPTFIFNNSDIDFNSMFVQISTDDYGIQRVTGILRTTFITYIEQNEYNLKIYDKDDNLIVDEENINEYNENIDYDMFYKETQDGTLIGDVREIYQPFKLIITKEDYSDLIIPDIYVTPGQPTIIRGGLLKPKAKIKIQNSTLYNSNVNVNIN